MEVIFSAVLVALSVGAIGIDICNNLRKISNHLDRQAHSLFRIDGHLEHIRRGEK